LWTACPFLKSIVKYRNLKNEPKIIGGIRALRECKRYAERGKRAKF
jgi:hypothetical protein